MSEYMGLSLTESKREHFRILREESYALLERARTEPILEYVSCPLDCTEQPRYLFHRDGASFMQCPTCGLIFVNPQLTEAALADHFATSPAWEVWAQNVLPSPEQQAFDRGKYESALEVMREIHPHAKEILDVGAGSGFFLSLAKESGFIVNGVEPSMAACEVAANIYGIELYNGRFSDLPSEGKSYDIVTFWASLEYQKHPKEALAKASDLLRQRGLLLVLISGNSHSLVMRILREQCVGFVFNRLWYFTPEALDLLVSKINPSFRLVERHSLIPSLDVISRYLNFEDPYTDLEPSLFSPDELDLLNELIERKNMGYKFLSIYRKEG